MKSNKFPNTMYHHILYAYSGVGKHEQIDIQVPIYTTEHHILTELQRRGKNVSRGFLQSLRYFIWERETARNYVDLSEKVTPTIEKTYDPDNPDHERIKDEHCDNQ